MTNPGPTFAQQRLVCLALVFGVGMFAIVIAVLQQQNDGRGLVESPPELLVVIAPVLGGTMLVAALVLRSILRRGAESQQGSARAAARFRATLLPMALLEGGCLFGLVVWMLSGRAVPGLVTALVLLSAMIALVPLQDPDATSNG